ncbi:hypothetical protein U3516DRAFT_758964 [Neocallimastix sp. 'constans']
MRIELEEEKKEKEKIKKDLELLRIEKEKKEKKKLEKKNYLVKKINNKRDNNETLLTYECKYDNIEEVKKLIHYGMNINKKNKNGDTPLLIACKNGNIELVKYLLSDELLAYSRRCIPNVPTYISNDHEHQNGTINSSLVGVIIGDWKFYNHQGLCFNSKRSIRGKPYGHHLSGTKNFRYWFKIIEQTAKNAGLYDFIIKDNVKEFKNNNRNNNNKEKIIEAEKIDASDMIRRLKNSYCDQQADTAFWIKELNSLKLNNKFELIKTLDKIDLDNIDERTLAEDYYNNLKSKIGMKAYLEDWHKSNSNNNNNNNLINNYPINEKTTINHIGKIRNKYKNNYYKEYNKNKFNGNGRFKTNKNNNKIKNKLYCHICKKHSHNTEKCRFNLLTNKKHLKNRRHSHSLSSNKQNNINFIEYNTNYIDNDKNQNSNHMKNNSLIYWLYGSGAAEHITNNINILSNFKQEKITLYCANGTLYEIEGYGECCLKINNHHIKLTKDKGIICTNAITLLFKKWVTQKIINNRNKTIGVFTENNNNQFFITSELSLHNETNMINSVQKLDEASKLIWHRRLGHFYYQNLEKYLELHNIKEPI